MDNGTVHIGADLYMIWHAAL